jgi:squalene-hopene/tetraprenyl-beta-curcumene cyclase
LPSTIEETAVAVDALASNHLAGFSGEDTSAVTLPIRRGVRWLIEHTKGGTEFPAAPIGLYFARLWYSEKLYPLIFTVSALGRASRVLTRSPSGRG